MGQRLTQRVVYLFTFLLTLPLATAATGISALDRPIELISRLFNVTVLQNPNVQIGFLKFAIFLMVFAVAHFSLKKFFDNKTAGVISFVISFSGAALMPREWVFASGGTITALVSAAVPLTLVGVGIYYSVKMLNNNENLGVRLFGLIIIFMLIALINIFKDATGLSIFFLLPAWLFRGES